MPQQAPQQQMQQPGAPAQGRGKNYMVFRHFETMDTQADRVALDPKRLAWLENLQPIAGNDLVSVPAPAGALATIAGQTIVKQFYANFGGNDFIINFTAAGAGYQVNIASGTVTQFAAASSYTDPDMTQWKSERILIADPTGSYQTWDGTVLAKAGTVSPNINVTNGGSGYTSTPAVAITGGTGSGATAVATVVGQVVTAITLTAAGSGYVAGDVLTVSITGGGGSGATATARIWPILSFAVATVAVFQGRVWLAGQRTLQWTGTAGYDDTNPANAAGSAVLADADVVRQITALRALNNYLYIFGDNSLKQIGTITVSGSATLFTITTLSSDQGTTFPQSIVSYNRLIIFANQVGAWAVFGATVQKLSDPMDGIFQRIDFTQKLVSATVDLRNIRVYMLLAKYNDPTTGTARSILLSFMNRKWFLMSQSSSMRCMASAPLSSVNRVYASSGSDVTRILVDDTVNVTWLMRTALHDDNKPMMGKRAIRVGVAQRASASSNITLTTDSENATTTQTYTVAFPIIWLNGSGQVVNWVNSVAGGVTFVTGGFLFRDAQAVASGIYLGASLSGSFPGGFHVNGIVLEYNDAALMRSRNT